LAREPAPANTGKRKTALPAAPPVPPPAPRAEAPAGKKVWVWVGAQASRQHLEESLTDGTNSAFRSLKSPGLFFRGGFTAGRGGLDFTYEEMPGEVSSSPSATVEGGAYHWSALRARAFWQASPEWRIKGGVDQEHSPLLYPDSSAGKIYLRSLSILSGALGVEWSRPLSHNGRLELGATYQRPLSASTLDRATASLDAKPSGQIALGYVHALGKTLRLGAYFQCDRQDYSFSYRDSPTASTSQGRQTLTSQSLGLRLGWEY
jgi:hypothetical protein